MNLGVGMSRKERWEVTDEMTALSVRSGGEDVLSTPLMECSAFELAEAGMDRGMTTVGIKVSLNHISPTPVGLVVWADARITRIRDNTIDFEITAYDKDGVIGEATHTRAVVNSKRFKSAAAKKLSD
jgi:predicted thioesterase